MLYLRHLYCGDYADCVASSGIYKIHFVGSDNFYVGSAVCLSDRWSGHRHHLINGSHGNRMIQRAWLKYGAENIRFTILELVPEKQQLIPREQFWMDTLKPAYNIAPTAGSMLGFKHGEESRKKISAGSKGRPKSPETIARWKESMIRVGGFIKTEERRRAISVGLTGLPSSIKGRKKGPMSQETKDRVSATKRAQNLHFFPSEETRAKLRAASVIREAAKKARGYKPSPEARQNISKGQIARRARARLAQSVFD